MPHHLDPPAVAFCVRLHPDRLASGPLQRTRARFSTADSAPDRFPTDSRLFVRLTWPVRGSSRRLARR